MRFPHQALMRIRPVSPLSDNPPDTNMYGDNIFFNCIANTTSGTFDPDIQFGGQDIATGAFGDLLDIWIRQKDHADLRAKIHESGTPFNAPLMLRLYGLYSRGLTVNREGMRVMAIDGINLLDDRETLGEGEQRERGFIGFPLTKLRVYPTMTAMTFLTKRTML